MVRSQLEAVLEIVDVKIDQKVFSKISRAVAKLPQGLKQAENATKGVTTQAKKAGQAFKKTADNVSAGARASNLFFKRMAQFAILLPAFSTLNRSLRGTVDFLVDFESSIRKIIALDIGGLADQFDNIAKASLRTAQEFGASALEVVQSTQLFVQAGFDLAEAQDKASAATLGAQVSTLSLANAQEVLIAVTKQFGDSAGTDIEIIDKLVRVEDLAAASAQDLADALRTGGNALAFATKSFDASIALIAGLTEQTRKSGREVGTFFKTLSTRITAAGEPRAALEALGIEVQNLDGSLRPMLDVLNETKVAFEGLTEAEQANFAKAVAGVRQFESLLATFKSLGKVNQLLAEGSDSSGTALSKFSERAETLENRFQKLVATGQELAAAIGDAGLTDFLKEAVSLATLLAQALISVVGGLDKVGIGITPILALAGAAGLRAAFGGGQKVAGAVGLGGAVGGGAAAAAVGGGGAAATAATTAATMSMANFDKGLRTGMMSLDKNSGSIAKLTGLQKIQGVAVGAAGKASRGFGKIMGNGAGRFAAFSVASVAAGSAMNLLAEKSTGGVKAFASMTGGGIQTGLQLAALNPALGVIVGSFTVLAGVTNAVIDALEQQKQGLLDQIAIDTRTNELNQERHVLRSGGEQAEDFLKAMVTGIKGQLGKDIDFAKIFNASGLEDKVDFEQFKELIFDPNQIKETAFALSKLDNALFADQQALEDLKNSFNVIGTTSDTAAETTRKFFRALGQVDTALETTGGVLDTALFPTLKAFKEFKTLTGSVESLVLLQESADRLNGPLASLTVGIDQLRIASDTANTVLATAQGEFKELEERLTASSFAREFGLGVEDAAEVVKKFREKVDKGSGPENVKDRTAFIAQQGPDVQKLFKEVVTGLNVLKAAEISSSQELIGLRVAVAEETKSILEAEITAQKAAQKSLNDFNIGLIQLGGSLESVEQIAGLSSDQIRDIVSGTSDLPQAIQDVIRSGFAGGAASAQSELAAVSAATEGRVTILSGELKILENGISALGQPLEGTTDFFKKTALQVESSAKSFEIEGVKREGLLKSTRAAIKVAGAQKKEMDSLEKSSASRVEADKTLLEESIKLEKQTNGLADSFADFAATRLGELIDEQADAQGELGETQAGVIENTKSLSEAQKEYGQSILEFNGILTEAKVQANLIARDIDMLTGGLSTFQERLSSLEGAFADALQDANITLQQRIELEKQLAEETLAFLVNAKSEIVGAGLAIFTQTGAENQKLQEGIAGLGFVADKLGGSLDNFFSMSAAEFDSLSQELLSLPADFRKNIASALSFLPSTADIGGFSPEQLKEALGQVGAGIAPEAGLPSIENLNAQQVAELQKLSALNTLSAQLQTDQLFAAQASVDVAREGLDLAKLQDDRAKENFDMIGQKIVDETLILGQAAALQEQLLDQLIRTDDVNTEKQLAQRAQLFSDQNQKFSEVGAEIVNGIAGIIEQRGVVNAASDAISAFGGHIPNYAKGKLTVKEAAGLLQAGAREKGAMPGGAGLAVANTSETIIPHRFKGQIPNFQGGNSPISAGIAAVRGVNETVVAAISRSVTQALAGIGTDGVDNTEEFQRMVAILQDVKDELQTISVSNASINASVATEDAAPGAIGGSNINITVQTNQNSAVQVTGLDQLREQLSEAVRDVTLEQVDGMLGPLFDELDSVMQVLRERGLQTSFGQSR